MLFSKTLAERLPVDQLIDVLIKKALKGKPWAIDTCLDRLIGKPIQTQLLGPTDQKCVITYASTPEEWAKLHGLDPEKVRLYLKAQGIAESPARKLAPWEEFAKRASDVQSAALPEAAHEGVDFRGELEGKNDEREDEVL